MERAAILVNRKSAVPLRRQLETALRNAILTGVIAPGARILSSRELQGHLGLSRNTVLEALDQLHAEGYLETRRGVGTFVSTHIQRAPKATRPQHHVRAVAPSGTAQRTLALRALVEKAGNCSPFRPGVPALDLFPGAAFKRALVPAEWDADFLDYAGPQGHLPLRDAIARRLQQTRGIVCRPDEIFITGGAQAAFSLVCEVLVNAGDTAVIEDPGYSHARAVLLAHGAKLFPAAVDSSGIDVHAFARKDAKLAYVTPSHQYPTGAVLSLDRRFTLLAWAAKHEAWIVEDDYDSEFNYTQRPQPALQGLDTRARVIYVGTFSKVLAPALRIAYVVVPPALRDAFAAVQSVGSGPPGAFLQSALARFMDDGHLGRHIAKMRKCYDERRRFAAGQLEKFRGAPLRVLDTRAGLHFVAELPPAVSDAEVSARAAGAGLIVPALSSYFYGKPARNGLVIGYAATAIPQAKKAIETLRLILAAAVR